MDTNEAPGNGEPARRSGLCQHGSISRDVTVRGAAGCLQWATHVASKNGRITVAGMSVSGRRNFADALEAAATALRVEIG